MRTFSVVRIFCAAAMALTVCQNDHANAEAADDNIISSPSKPTTSKPSSNRRQDAAGKRKSSTATVWATTGFKNGAGAGVVKVDGQSIGTWGPRRTVPAGKHTLTVDFTGSRGFWKGLIEGQATVTATLKAGGSYYSVAHAKDDKVRVWIEEEKTGKRVSNVDTPDVSIAPIDIPIIVY